MSATVEPMYAAPSWPYSPTSMSRHGKRRAEDVAERLNGFHTKRARLNTPPAPLFAAPVTTTGPQLWPQPARISTPTPASKRPREEEPEEEIITVDLTPLTKRARHEDSHSLLDSRPRLPIVVDDDQPLAAAEQSLALVPYTRAPHAALAETAQQYQVHELLTGKLREQAWQPYRRHGLDERHGQVVIYTGGKWVPPPEEDAPRRYEEMEESGARDEQESVDRADDSVEMMDVDM
ncbi:hypothetical protein DFJ77DRAFT_455036 [Powellomyces hirtus]|nr:hypothetical protein DFJ77DRAFT_455036 [Powellomyces hirtus]